MKDLRLITITLAMMTFVACGPIQRTRQSEDTPVRTPETENLLINLKKYQLADLCSGIMTIPTTV